jgi:hypothetical protein
MESHLPAARDAIKETIARLDAVVPKAEMNRPMTLNALTPHLQTLATSFGREVRGSRPVLRNVAESVSSCGMQVSTPSIIGQWLGLSRARWALSWPPTLALHHRRFCIAMDRKRRKSSSISYVYHCFRRSDLNCVA